jgi:glutamate carboxypeptidase
MLKHVLAALSAREAEMFTLLEKMVLVQSGTFNKTGVDCVGQIVTDFFADLPLHCKRVVQDRFGDHLVFTTPATEADSKNNILITGHMDTVFPEDTDFNSFREDGDKVYGPGVIDMKGGLVVTMFAVQALADAGLLARIPLVLLFNSDEETGSPTSTPLIEDLAKTCCCALVTECGGMQGQVVTGRRGKTGYRLDVHGRSGHAAFAGMDKASAIVELCRLVPELEQLNNPEQGQVVNVGRVEGGIGPNTVAGHAWALIDTRYGSVYSGSALQKSIEQCLAEPGIPGTSSEMTITNRRPVMEQTEANKNLYRIIEQQADRLGIRISDELRPGVSDASNIAGQGIPVVDGLGPIGEFDHSSREYMLKNSLLQRCRLLTASIFELNRLNLQLLE